MTPKPPFSAEHVGSLLRPKAVQDAREKYKQNLIPEAELRQVEDQAIRDAVRML